MSELHERETAAFLDAALPRAARVLEIGCGAGVVAMELGRRGHTVVALDSDPVSVEKARGLGANAVLARFPDFDGGPFDAVAFTRSMHHLDLLDESIARARALLAPEGVLLIEDWAWDRVDAPTAAWLRGTAGFLVELGILKREDWSLEGDPLESWLEEHRHLHGEERMLAAVDARFAREHTERVPYVFRYVSRGLARWPDPEAAALSFLRLERDLIERGLIRALGLRIVARPRP